VLSQAIIFMPMPIKNQRSRLIGWAILPLLMLGCAGNGRGAFPPAAVPAPSANTASNPVKNRPAQIPRAPAEPLLRDSTGLATFPEIDKSENVEGAPEIPGIADTNLIDDPSKEWK
jgi:hypothetical protein